MKIYSNKVIRNSFYQYLMMLAQYIFPFMTFPYLTRILGPENYAIITYMTSFIVYFQQFIDFGFILFSTKKIAENQNKKRIIEFVWTTTTYSKLILSGISTLFFLISAIFIEIVNDNFFIAFLYYLIPIMSIFLPDYLFRGLEDMGIFTTRYIITKSITTILTFVVVKDNTDVIYIPILNLMSSLIAIIMTQYQIKRKYEFKMMQPKLKYCFIYIKQSAYYFISTASSSAFGVFNTFMLGALTISARDLGYWGAFYGLITTAQSLYSPIINSIFPHISKEKDLTVIKKILLIFMPLIIITTCLVFIFSKTIIYILCGKEFVDGVLIFQLLLPLLVFSFPVLILNYPTLGACGYIKEIAKLTFNGAIFHIFGLFLLAILDQFNIYNVAILRCGTELVLLIQTIYYIKKKKIFKLNKIDK